MLGNQMTMREVLDRIFSRFSVDGLGRHWIRLNEYDWQLIQSALSAPPRQCDVGSPEVQGIRCLATMRHWRKAYQGDALITDVMKWAQTPYTEEVGAE